VDGAQPGGDGPDRLLSAGPPGVADGDLAGKGGREQPLRLVVGAPGEDAGRRVTIRQPREADALAFEVDAGASRVPLQVLVVDAERQPSELVAPDEVGRSTGGHVCDDRRDGIVAQRVEGGEVGEVGIRHLARGPYAASPAGGHPIHGPPFRGR
jgi:hypothetical protein